MKLRFTSLIAGMLVAHAVSAATLVDLRTQSVTYLKPFFAAQAGFASQQTYLKSIRTDIDFNRTAHMRLQQTYAGFPVWDAIAIVHTPSTNLKNNNQNLFAHSAETTLHGVIYTGIEHDLANTQSYALSEAQKTKAWQTMKLTYEKKTGVSQIQYRQESIKTIIFLDENKKAHYAYLLSADVDDGKTGAHRPTMIIDAASLQIYRSWDQVLTEKTSGDIETTVAGGIGGNEKIGQIIYDGDTGHLPGLTMLDYKTDIEVLPGQNIMYSLCLFENDDLIVKDVSYDRIAMGLCYAISNKHHNVAWLDWDNNETRWKIDEVNGGYSPSLDAFYAATIIKNLYQDWFHVPVLTEEDGKTPMKLVMRVHYGRNFDNAFFDGKQMTFGDGGKFFYPLASLGVGAHEISHGFTMQHSNIDFYHPQMAALHESFSDMAAIAAEYYVTGSNHWDIGREVTKTEGALRYFDDPKKDGRSIDHMKDFDETEAHLGAGIFNKAFYLIATSKGWDTHKAFNVMVKANMYYWNGSMVTFADAACGVVSATKDYQYNVADVRVAFAKVGVETDQCDVH